MNKGVLIATVIILALFIIYLILIYKPEERQYVIVNDVIDVAPRPVIRDILREHIETAVPENAPSPPNEIDGTDKVSNLEQLQRNNHAEDSQNVHESRVDVEITRRYKRLCELTGMVNEIGDIVVPNNLSKIMSKELWTQHLISETKKEIQSMSNDMDELSQKKLEAVLEAFTRESVIQSLSDNCEITDVFVLCMTWYRINSDANSSVRNSLRKALLQQLLDCAESHTPDENVIHIHNIFRNIMGIRAVPNNTTIITVVCIKGRVARLFQTFTILDTDAILAEPIKDKCEYQNEAFTKAHNILNHELTKFETNTSRSMSDIYTDDPKNLNQIELKLVDNFEDHVKNKIAETIKSDYKNILSEAEITEIIEKAHAGI